MKKAMKQGFTLIELMVVVIIVGILAAVAIPKMSSNTDKAVGTEAVAALGTLNTAAELYAVEADVDTSVDNESLDLSALTANGFVSESDLNGTYFDGEDYTAEDVVAWDAVNNKFEATSLEGNKGTFDITWNADTLSYRTTRSAEGESGGGSGGGSEGGSGGNN